MLPLTLGRGGTFDLRVRKRGRVAGCASPQGLFPEETKYACSGDFGTQARCDGAERPMKEPWSRV